MITFNMKRSIIGVLLLFQISSHAKIYGPKRYDYKGLAGFVASDVYYAKENFDANAQAQNLPSSGSYLLADFPFGFRYIYGGNMGFETELKASFAQSESSDFVNGATRSNSALSELRVSGDYLFETSSFDLIPEVEIIVPFAKVDPNGDTVLVSEGVQSIITRLHLQTEFGATDLFSHIGYEQRDKGRSDLMPWSVGLGWQYGKSYFAGRLFGFQSISDDSQTNTAIVRETYLNKVNGGAAKFYSVNPNVISTEGIMSFRLNPKWEMQFRAGLDIAGENYSKGFFAGASFILDWGLQNRTLRRRPVKPTKSKPDVRGSGIAIDPGSVDFKEQMDDQQRDDQQYFAPPPPPRPKPQPKPRGPVAPSDQQIQQQLDDVEMKIELKKKKGR